MADDPKQLSKELALRQIEAIKVLRQNEHFQNYFLRRIKDKHANLLDRLIHDPATKKITQKIDGKDVTVEVPFCTKEQREEIRQVVLAYEELLFMMDRDYASASGFLHGDDTDGMS